MLLTLRGSLVGMALTLSGCTQDKVEKEAPLSIESVEAQRSVAQRLATPHLRIGSSHSRQDFKADEYPGGAFIVSDFGSPPDGDAALAIAGLEAIAKSGQSKASYEIYLKLNQCLNALKDVHAQRALSSDVSTANDCQSLGPDDYAKTSEWLVTAAQQGSLGAQLLYASDPSIILGNPSEMLRDPEAISAYKEQANSYLRNAASRGSIDALSALSDVYLNGIMAEQDLTISYAYHLTMGRVDPELISKRRIEYFEKTLGPSQVSEAHLKSQGIYNDCCNRRSPQ